MKKWYKTKLGQYLITSFGIAGLIVGFSLLNHTKELVHVIWIFLGTITFLPFLLILLILLMFLAPIAFGILAIFVGEFPEAGFGSLGTLTDGPGLAEKLLTSTTEEGHSRESWFISYYQFFAQQKHPIFWGGFSGLIFGGTLLSLLVLPQIAEKEALTVNRMHLIETELQHQLMVTGAFPTPTPQGTLILPHPDLAADAEGQVLDGFENPYHYTKNILDLTPYVEEQKASEKGFFNKAKAFFKKNKRKKILEEAQQDHPNQEASSFNLISQGYNPNNSNDDFCISGNSDVLNNLKNKNKGGIKGFFFGRGLKEINELRCR